MSDFWAAFLTFLVYLGGALEGASFICPDVFYGGVVTATGAEARYLFLGKSGDSMRLEVVPTEGDLLPTILLLIYPNNPVIYANAVDQRDMASQPNSVVLEFELEQSGWYIARVFADSLALPTTGVFRLHLTGTTPLLCNLLPE